MDDGGGTMSCQPSSRRTSSSAAGIRAIAASRSALRAHAGVRVLAPSGSGDGQACRGVAIALGAARRSGLAHCLRAQPEIAGMLAQAAAARRAARPLRSRTAGTVAAFTDSFTVRTHDPTGGALSIGTRERSTPAERELTALRHDVRPQARGGRAAAVARAERRGPPRSAAARGRTRLRVATTASCARRTATCASCEGHARPGHGDPRLGLFPSGRRRCPARETIIAASATVSRARVTGMSASEWGNAVTSSSCFEQRLDFQPRSAHARVPRGTLE